MKGAGACQRPRIGLPPRLFYTCFYNHARRLRLEKLLCLEVSTATVEVLTDCFKPLLGPDGGFTSETAARRFRMLNGRYTAVSEVKRPNI
jgi:hypothetical protein